MVHRTTLLVLLTSLAMASISKGQEPPATTPSAKENSNAKEKARRSLKIATRKPEDRVKCSAKGDRLILSVTSPSGIGGAKIQPGPNGWPKKKRLVVRLYLRGLESLSISNGKVRLAVEVQSHGERRQLLHLWEGKKETSLDAKSPYWTKARVFNADDKPTKGSPEKGGYLEMPIPRVLLKDNPESLEIRWIDFYRG